MSSLTYYTYPGVGERNARLFNYSQAVRVGDRIECAGQGGWHPDTGVFPQDTIEQIDQAFKNVDLALRQAGGSGWDQVFRVNSYHVNLDDASLQAMSRNLAHWAPSHKPIWTCIGVTRLGEPDMLVEVEVCAYAPK